MGANGLGLWRCAIVSAAIAGSYCTGAIAQEPPALSHAAHAMSATGNSPTPIMTRFAALRPAPMPQPAATELTSTGIAKRYFLRPRRSPAGTLYSYGTLRLLDGRGNAVIELTEAEAGIFDGFQPGEGRYVLQSAAAAPVRSAEELVGDWAIARGTGKPICVLTLASNPAASDKNNPAGADNLSLKVKPGCDPFVARFGLTFLADRSRRSDPIVGARTNLAVRRRRRQYLAAGAGDCRPGPVGAAAMTCAVEVDDG